MPLYFLPKYIDIFKTVHDHVHETGVPYNTLSLNLGVRCTADLSAAISLFIFSTYSISGL